MSSLTTTRPTLCGGARNHHRHVHTSLGSVLAVVPRDIFLWHLPPPCGGEIHGQVTDR
jgi:hypothetical protein